jgi:integrase
MGTQPHLAITRPVSILGLRQLTRQERIALGKCQRRLGRDGEARVALPASRIVVRRAPRVKPPLDRHTALRAFRRVIAAAGLPPGEWVPRELRHSFVSLLSDDGMPLENTARLVGHDDTTTTETVYRKQIRPVVLDGATAMDRIFSEDKSA